ncbi:hypothetical protein [Desulfovibrio sp. TomC]|uniref:hypothetical protein n=1 Tax=Desulfovibrio sp. TomC TaxID=1562888 RepID=UPI0005737D2E|nr:hypothetical protein [Desulfovibrio sp. TomC]KHK02586.1 hypothetical protein NY78_1943 [Desulfovibrio sp. TomC]
MNVLPRPAGRYLAALCLSALAVLAFWGYLRTGATTSDDLVYEQAVITHSLGTLCTELATRSGRFHHYLHVGLTSLPYSIDSLPARKALSLGVALAVVAALAALAARLAASPVLGFLVATLGLSLYQDNWHHNILTAYPLVFDAGMLWLLGAGYALLRHGETARRRWLVLANTAMFLAFCHFEAFVAYLPVLAGIVFLTGRGRLRHRLAACCAAFAVVPVYAGIYLGYRFTHPSAYDGNALDLQNPLRVLETALAYSRSALPLGAFDLNLEYINRFPQATSRYVLSFGHYLADLAGNWPRFDPAWIAMGLLAGGLTAVCLRRAEATFRPRFLAVVLAVYAVVCPNLLIALSPKYQEPAAGGLAWYVTSNFSFYAVAVLLALGLLAAAGRLPGRLRPAAATLLGLCVGLTVFVNASVNASVRESKIAAAGRWRVAELAARSPALEAVPDGAILVAPDLFAAVNVELTAPDYWSAYFAHRTGRTLTVLPGLPPTAGLIRPAEPPVYVLRRLSAPTATVTSLALGRVSRLGPPAADPYAKTPDAPQLLADDVLVVVDGANQLLDIFYRDAAGWQVAPARVGGRLGSSQTRLAGDGIALSSLALLPARTIETGAVSPLELRFGQGFSAPERAITGDVVWAGQTAQASLDNAGPLPVRVRLAGSVVAMSPVRVRVSAPGLETVLDCTARSTPLTLELTLPPGRSRLTFAAEGDTGTADKRFGLLGLTLRAAP